MFQDVGKWPGSRESFSRPVMKGASGIMHFCSSQVGSGSRRQCLGDAWQTKRGMSKVAWINQQLVIDQLLTPIINWLPKNSAWALSVHLLIFSNYLHLAVILKGTFYSVLFLNHKLRYCWRHRETFGNVITKGAHFTFASIFTGFRIS